MRGGKLVYLGNSRFTTCNDRIMITKRKLLICVIQPGKSELKAPLHFQPQQPLVCALLCLELCLKYVHTGHLNALDLVLQSLDLLYDLVGGRVVPHGEGHANLLDPEGDVNKVAVLPPLDTVLGDVGGDLLPQHHEVLLGLPRLDLDGDEGALLGLLLHQPERLGERRRVSYEDMRGVLTLPRRFASAFDSPLVSFLLEPL